MNKEIIEKYMDEVWNKKNLSIIEELFAEDAKIHSTLGNFVSPQKMKETVEKWLTAIPDIRVDLLHTLEDDGVIASHWKAKGTHRHEINGITASNQPVEYQGVTMYRLENGKIVEYWAYLDGFSFKGAQA